MPHSIDGNGKLQKAYELGKTSVIMNEQNETI